MSVVPWGALQQGRGVVKPIAMEVMKQEATGVADLEIMKGQWHGLVLLWTDTVGRRFREETSTKMHQVLLCGQPWIGVPSVDVEVPHSM